MKKTIIGFIVPGLVFAVLYIFVSYAWIGAEYRLEGIVHYGKVDRFATCYICCWIVNYIYGMSNRYKKKDNTDGKHVHM